MASVFFFVLLYEKMYVQSKKEVYTFINFASKIKLERLKSKSFPFFCCTERQCFRESAMCPRLVFSFLYIPTLLPQYAGRLVGLLVGQAVCYNFLKMQKGYNSIALIGELVLFSIEFFSGCSSSSSLQMLT